MILGIGIDLVEVERVTELLGKYSGRFATRVFTEEERAYCEKMAQPGQHYAARFAAKEAFLKAIGTGFAKGISWKDIGVAKLPSGEPILELRGRALDELRARGGTRALVTLSHTHGHACAAVAVLNESET
ncbi:MAG: holo-ACP synthase [Candidatus Sumerlaeota bacterium]|nr:holo-ACP synthase [Candidatus Sumerlaeota bacterium]